MSFSMLTFQIRKVTSSIPIVSLIIILKERCFLTFSKDELFIAIYLVVDEYDLGNSRITFAGMPAARTFSGKLFLTSEHAPITQLSPI